MNTIQIHNKLAPVCKNFVGVYPSNRLPRLSKKGWLVMNISPDSHSGLHWVVVGCGEYFDPLGLTPVNKTVIDYLNRCRKRWWFNRYPLQKFGSTVCGQFCIHYIMMRCKGYTPTRIVHNLWKMSDPEKYVYHYVNKM